jgi:hypothetical protein
MWGSEFTTKAATLQGSSCICARPLCSGPWLSCCPRPLLVQGAARAEELAERRRAHSVDHAGLEVREHRAGQVLAALGPVVKHLDAVNRRRSSKRKDPVGSLARETENSVCALA